MVGSKGWECQWQGTGQISQSNHWAHSSRLCPHPNPLQLESQYTALHNDKDATRAENTQLKLSNQELARELERASQELQEAQQQLGSLQQEACQLQREKEM